MMNVYVIIEMGTLQSFYTTSRSYVININHVAHISFRGYQKEKKSSAFILYTLPVGIFLGYFLIRRVLRHFMVTSECKILINVSNDNNVVNLIKANIFIYNVLTPSL